MNRATRVNEVNHDMEEDKKMQNALKNNVLELNKLKSQSLYRARAS